MPSWAPLWLRQGWAEKFRIVNGFPMHPSVHQRFAAKAVDENGKRQPYRPHNLRNDTRFIWYYGGTDPDQGALEQRQAAATYECDADAPISFRLGKANPKLAALLKIHQASSAVGIFPGNPKPDADSAYLDAMALDMLADHCRKASLRTASLRRLPSSPDGIAEQGLLVSNLDNEDASILARSFGATTLIAIDKSGKAELRSLVP